MNYRELGNTKLKVSRLCFGSLTISPLQANLDIPAGAEVITKALDRGINFIDTAELYQNYAYIKKALVGRRQQVILSTKCYAYDKAGAEKSLQKALKELDTDYIDIFSLHEQESEHTIKGHYEAIEYFLKAKEKGIIRSFGISTHTVAAVKASLKYKEIEVLHPIINKAGLGITDGSIENMLSAVEAARKRGKGIFSMKPLGGGNLLKNASECFDFVLQNPNIDSIAVGMQNTEEVECNIRIFEGKEVPESLKAALSAKKRKLLVDFWCTGCGRCAAKCGQKAIAIEENKAKVNIEKCVLCGYCSAHCPDFCLKII